jgi:hypothetical protein
MLNVLNVHKPLLWREDRAEVQVHVMYGYQIQTSTRSD